MNHLGFDKATDEFWEKLFTRNFSPCAYPSCLQNNTRFCKNQRDTLSSFVY